MSERELQKAVIELAQRLGWLVAHFPSAPVRAGKYVTPTQGDSKGFPDLVLVRRHRLLFVELKAKAGRVRPDQKKWMDTLKEVNFDPLIGNIVEVYLWKPEDWVNGTVERMLKWNE